MAALNRTFLRFSPDSYTSGRFHKASSGSIYLVCADTISIPSTYVSFHVIFSLQSQILHCLNITGPPRMSSINSPLSTTSFVTVSYLFKRSRPIIFKNSYFYAYSLVIFNHMIGVKGLVYKIIPG